MTLKIKKKLLLLLLFGGFCNSVRGAQQPLMQEQIERGGYKVKNKNARKRGKNKRKEEAASAQMRHNVIGLAKRGVYGGNPNAEIKKKKARRGKKKRKVEKEKGGVFQRARKRVGNTIRKHPGVFSAALTSLPIIGFLCKKYNDYVGKAPEHEVVVERYMAEEPFSRQVITNERYIDHWELVPNAPNGGDALAAAAIFVGTVAFPPIGLCAAAATVGMKATLDSRSVPVYFDKPVVNTVQDVRNVEKVREIKVLLEKGTFIESLGNVFTQGNAAAVGALFTSSYAAIRYMSSSFMENLKHGVPYIAPAVTSVGVTSLYRYLIPASANFLMRSNVFALGALPSAYLGSRMASYWVGFVQESEYIAAHCAEYLKKMRYIERVFEEKPDADNGYLLNGLHYARGFVFSDMEVAAYGPDGEGGGEDGGKNGTDWLALFSDKSAYVLKTLEKDGVYVRTAGAIIGLTVWAFLCFQEIKDSKTSVELFLYNPEYGFFISMCLASYWLFFRCLYSYVPLWFSSGLYFICASASYFMCFFPYGSSVNGESAPFLEPLGKFVKTTAEVLNLVPSSPSSLSSASSAIASALGSDWATKAGYIFIFILLFVFLGLGVKMLFFSPKLKTVKTRKK